MTQHLDQPSPADPHRPRYSDRPFPPYRFIPGRFPHPRLDPHGHSFGQPEPDAEPVAPERWMDSECYCYGIDLFNYAYWWECHEELEALWNEVGHDTEQGIFLQGIVQVAAACLHRFMNSSDDAGRSLAYKGLARLQHIGRIYMGIDIPRFTRDVEEFFAGENTSPPVISLNNGQGESTVAVGLCQDCRHAQTIQSSRGSSFIRCALSTTDDKFPKYPTLPVRECPGYTSASV